MPGLDTAEMFATERGKTTGGLPVGCLLGAVSRSIWSNVYNVSA